MVDGLVGASDDVCRRNSAAAAVASRPVSATRSNDRILGVGKLGIRKVKSSNTDIAIR